MKEEKEISDERILFPEVEIETENIHGEKHTYSVRPWTFGELIKINPLLEEIFIQMEKRGTTIDLENLNLSAIKNVYFSAVPQIGKILCKTLDIPEEEVGNLSVDSVLKLVMTMIHSNRGSLGNFFDLFFGPSEAEEVAEEKEKVQ